MLWLKRAKQWISSIDSKQDMCYAGSTSSRYGLVVLDVSLIMKKFEFNSRCRYVKGYVLVEQASKCAQIIVDGKCIEHYGPGITKRNIEAILYRSGWKFDQTNWENSVFLNGHTRRIKET